VLDKDMPGHVLESTGLLELEQAVSYAHTTLLVYYKGIKVMFISDSRLECLMH